MTDLLNPNHDTDKTSPSEGVSRHASFPKPLEEAADILTSIAREPDESLSEVVKARGRAALIAHAEQMEPSSVPSSVSSPTMSEQPKVAPSVLKNHSKWRSFLFGFAGVLSAAVLILVFVSPFGLRPGPSSNSLVSALSIPAAFAADAFVLAADSSDAAGVSADTTITITSKIDVAPDVLKQSLRIEPPLEVDVTRTGNDTYRLTPKEPLEAGETYRISIETLVDQDDGSRLRREFSWALQTKNDMRVLSSIPRDGSGSVPVTTGIEFKLSRDGFADATSSFSIVPVVEGRFDVRGRYLTFVPKMPLEAGRRYEVKLKSGFGSGVDDDGLSEDVLIRFETAAPIPSGPSVAIPMQFSIDEFQEESPNKTWMLSLGYAPVRQGDDTVRAEIIGYRLEPSEAKKMLEARLQVPTWAPAEAGRFEAYEKATRNEAFRLEADTVITNYKREVSMPSISPGFYAIRVTPKASQGGRPTWFFLQATNVVSYLIADKDRFFAWTINPSTNRPLENMRLRIGGQEKRTDSKGLVELKTPNVLTRTDVKPGDIYPFEIVEYGDEGSALRAFGVVRRTYDGYWFDFGNSDASISGTWNYLYTDRPLYRTTDELKLFGLAQDRDSHRSVGEIEIRLRKQNYLIDWGTGEDKVYQSKTVQTDAAGRFEAAFDWTELSQGYYSIETWRDEERISSRSIEVREFAKPAYAISVAMDRDSVFDGDEIAGTVKAAFFEGTPMSKLRVRVSWDGGSTVVETDDSGFARFKVPYRLSPCGDANNHRSYCSQSVWLNVHAVPESGEEGETFGAASVAVYRSQAAMSISATGDYSSATVTGSVWRQDLNADDKGRSVSWANRPVTLIIRGHHWEKIPNGYQYDPIEKNQFEIFRYEERWDDPITVSLTTDARGNFVHTFPLDETRSYYVVAETRDEQSRVARSQRWVWPGLYGSASPPQAPREDGNVQPAYPSLDISPHPPESGPRGYGIGEEVKATYLLGTQSVDASKLPGILYIVGSRGIRSAIVTGSEYVFRFDDAWVPNAGVRAITWRDGKFETLRADVAYRSDEKAMSIEAKPTKEKYAPGETVEIEVNARIASSGNPVRDTVIAYSAVDKALLALAFDEDASPLGWIYGYVSDGVIFTARTHDKTYEGFGGAEKGGGGYDRAALSAQVRKNFKDTAAFGTIKTDGNGHATIRFEAPDNITGWRLELIGVSGNLEVGATRADINVTKPVFVDVVAPPRVLTTDVPFLKLRAFGAGLSNGEDVTFTVQAPTLGIDEVVQGKAGQPVFVGIQHLIDGDHAVTVGLGSVNGSDAIERRVTVVPSRFTQDEFVRVDAAPGSALPNIGRPEARILFVPKNRAALEPLAQSLVWTQSNRSDALLASRYAADLLKEEFNAGEDPWWGSYLPDDQTLAARLADYQDNAGGIRFLSYGGGDLELSAEVAATVPEYVDQDTLSGYFWTVLDNKKSSREQQIHALAGLAALGGPVLPSLQEVASIEGLEWREQLAIARGLEAAGDRERARGLLEKLLEKAERRDDVMRLAVSDREADVYEATADAAALAARLALPEAENLMRFVETNWVEDGFPVLAKARYLQAAIATRANRDIALKYTLGDGESALTFAKGNVQSINITAEEASRFRVTSVDGPVAITFLRRSAGRPTSVPEVAISRSYDAGKPLSDLHEGDSVQITLKPTWQSNAQDGCYVVRDNLPGGWQAVVGWGADQAYKLQTSDYGWYPFLVEDGTVSFYACKHTGGETVIHYTARVVSRGTYTAEAPLIQHEEFPSVAAVGRDMTIEIK